MQIKNSSLYLVSVWLWACTAVISMITVLFKLKYPNIFSLSSNLMSLTVFLLAVINVVLYYKIYETPMVILYEDKISLFAGLLRARVEFMLSDLISVERTKFALIFKKIDKKRKLPLQSISKDGRTYIFEYLQSNNITILSKGR